MKKELLRSLPSIDELLKTDALREAARDRSPQIVKDVAREALSRIRAGIIEGTREVATLDEITAVFLDVLSRALEAKTKKIVNASGTILHTNIGRAVLADAAVEAMVRAAGNVNVEFDLSKGERGERDEFVFRLIERITNAESAAVVNNNAAAVLLTLDTLAEGREVIISRGELIEIGGSFRLPDIIKKSCVLREVGTTNRTHPSDYENAINGNTALILKAHTSNYKVVGFTAQVDLRELSAIAKRHGVPLVEDLGSGSLVDLSRYGLPKEPVVRESLEAGADIVTFSGDKLLGGPQAGIIAGKKEFVARIRKNPLKRAMRADKVTLAALEATLMLYLEPERLTEKLPTLKYLARPADSIKELAFQASRLLKRTLGECFEVEIVESESVVGGGSLPGHPLPTWAVAISSNKMSADEIFRLFLSQSPPVLGRIKNDIFLLDMRTIEDPADLIPRQT